MQKKLSLLLLSAFLAHQPLSAAQKTKPLPASPKESAKSIGMTDAQVLEKVASLQLIQMQHFSPIKIMDGGSTYLVKGGFLLPSGDTIPGYMYVTKDFKTVVFGQAFNAESGQPFSQFEVEQLRAASAITYGTGKDEIIIVTDPLCPYCKRLEKELPKYKDYLTVHLVFIALPMHKEAPQAIDYILSKKTDVERFAAMSEIADEKTPYKDAAIDAAVLEGAKQKRTEMEKIARELKVQGTPSLFDIHGMPMSTNFFAMLSSQIAYQERQGASAPQ